MSSKASRSGRGGSSSSNNNASSSASSQQTKSSKQSAWGTANEAVRKAPDGSAPAATEPTKSSTTTEDNGMTGDYYFDSYAHFGIHEEMLKDSVRTKTYMASIVDNPHLFKDKIVLDVGCGTGILSMFAAKAGAKLVVGVDMSGITKQAQEIVEKNGLSDTVKIVRGKVEEVDLKALYGIDKVDIIISEWMGYMLLYESMLDSVIIARDKWLIPGGLIFPDKATLWMVGIEDATYKHEKIGFWDDVYGFDFSCIKPLALVEPLVDTVDPNQVMTKKPCKLLEIDITKVKNEDLNFSAKFSLEAQRDDYMHGVLMYFHVVFSACHTKIGFGTAPSDIYTHWKQTTLYLKEDLTICEGEKVTGVFTCQRNQTNHRELDMTLSYEFKGKHQKCTRTNDAYRLR